MLMFLAGTFVVAILGLLALIIFSDRGGGPGLGFAGEKGRPDIFSLPSVYLSLVVPAYNEEARFPEMMAETVDYLKKRSASDPKFSWEIVVVDDGSKDKTVHVARETAKNLGVADKIRVHSLPQNMGKGYAVKTGMLLARGEYLLMVDADGATKISDVEKLEAKLIPLVEKSNGNGVAVGSRAGLDDDEGDAKAKRKPLRILLMKGFHLLVSLCVSGVRDTQCGFKLFARQTAQQIFPNQHLNRWCFDAEILMIAQMLGYPLVEVKVNWHEVAGSKVSIVADSAKMAKDLVRIRLNYLLRIWKIKVQKID